MHKSRDRSKLSNPRRRVLLAVRDLGGEHVTVNQLAEHLGGHPNASRAHLAALADRGYLAVADIPGTGPGRRPRGHTLTEAGRSALDPAETTGATLTGAFASYLVRTGHGPRESHEIGRQWGHTQAAVLDGPEHDDPVAAVLRVLDILGFDPGRVRTPEGEALVLRTCPLVGNGHDDQAFACGAHHGMIDGVLRRIGAAEGITLAPFAETADRLVEVA